MSAGDSHTGFNSGAFTAGAVGGASVLAAAVGAGLENARQQSWARWNRKALEAAAELNGLRNNRVVRMLEAANRKVSDLQSEVVAVRAELKAERARALLAQRRK